jgi:hypothetical protein
MRIAPLLVAALCLGSVARAQIELRLSTDRDFFLPGEELDLTVKVANFSGGPLTLGEQPDWIRFTVERSDSGVVNKLSEVSESGSFTLEHATVGTLHFNLMPHFALDRPGTYQVVAQATTPKSAEIYSSGAKTFEIVSGVRLNPDRVLGVTLPDGTTVKRKYILQQVNFLRKLRLYLRVTDGDESTNFKVTNLGNVVTFDPPRWVVDRQNRFHVLHRVDANSSAYHLFETNGQITRRELYRYTTTTPELRVNEAGEVAVIGGVRRPSPGDIPAPGTNRPPAKVTTADLKPEENAKPPTEPTPDRKP